MTKQVRVIIGKPLYDLIINEKKKLVESEKKKVKSRKKQITMVTASVSIARRLR